MIDKFKKALGIEVAPKVEAVVAPAVVKAALSAEDALELVAAYDALQAVSTEQGATLASLAQELASAKAALEAANTALAGFAEARAKAEADAKTAKMAARKATVVDVIGDLKADAFLAATENLDDGAFDAVASALTGRAADEAASKLFREVGVDAQADATNTATESAEARILRAQYAAK
jgi:hypothetical protein